MLHYNDLKNNVENYVKEATAQEVAEFLKRIQFLILQELSYNGKIETYTVRVPRIDINFIKALKEELNKLGYAYKIGEVHLYLYLGIKLDC